MSLLCGTVSAGADTGCMNNGGSSTLYLSTYLKTTDWTTSTSSVTAVTGANTYWDFEQGSDIIAYSGSDVFNKDNRTYGFDNMIVFRLYEADADTFENLLTLRKTDISAIVKTRGGRYLVFGVEVAGFVETTEGGLEPTRDGINGFIVTLKWDDTRPPYEMSAAVFASDITVGS